VSIDDCAEVHRTVLPRLELLLDDRDVALQVASPGIERTMKDPRELEVFAGRGVKILKRDSEDWVAGIVRSADAQRVELKTADGVHEIALSDIRKAKLDYTQEVG
jgi:ribosome maturation factor RimP